MKATLLVLQDNEEKKVSLLVRHWFSTKDGICVKNFDGSYKEITSKEYNLWDVQEIDINKLNLLSF